MSQALAFGENWPVRRAPARCQPTRSLAGWLRAAVAGLVVAGLAGTTSLVTASMLARLTRAAGRRGRRPRWRLSFPVPGRRPWPGRRTPQTLTSGTVAGLYTVPLNWGIPPPALRKVP